MRILPYVTVASVMLLLTACASHSQSPTQMCSNFINQQHVIPTTSGTYPVKNPEKIALYENSDSPHAPYRIIAMASVSRHNLLGVKRSDDTMQSMMKQLAANMGGDGVINMSTSPNDLKAHVIAFQKILI